MSESCSDRDKLHENFEEVLSEKQLFLPNKIVTLLVGVTIMFVVLVVWHGISGGLDGKTPILLDVVCCCLFLVSFFATTTVMGFNRSLLPRRTQLEKGLLYVYSGGTRTLLGEIKDIPMRIGSSLHDNLIGLRMTPRKCILLKIGLFRNIAVGLNEEAFEFWSEIMNSKSKL